MIVKLGDLVSCSSENPSYPAINLLNYRPGSVDKSTWLCEKPGIRESEVIFKLSEPSQISGVDIGNSRCCSVRIEGSTSEQPDEWVTIVSHEFMTRNEADDGRFKDQVKLFTKKEISEEILRMIFDRVKITCVQSANLKVLFGLAFLVLRADDKVDTGGLDAFGRFKIKDKKDDSLDKFKEKYMKQIRQKPRNFKDELAKQIETSRAIAANERHEAPTPRKRPSLRRSTSPNADGSGEIIKREGNTKTGEIDEERPVKRSKLTENCTNDSEQSRGTENLSSRNETVNTLSKDTLTVGRRLRCSLCLGNEENVLCKTCNLLLPEKKEKSKDVRSRKPSRPKKRERKFNALFDGVIFSLSGYKNPERNIIRGKAIAMGAKYVADTNRGNHGCTHLVCAFKNTPKYGQLKGRAKIVNHRWVEECYDKKTR